MLGAILGPVVVRGAYSETRAFSRKPGDAFHATTTTVGLAPHTLSRVETRVKLDTREIALVPSLTDRR